MTDYRPGDRIAIVDRHEITVAFVDATHVHGRDGSSYSLRRAERRALNTTRTIEIVERAPIPWQDGDVALTRTVGYVVVRDGGHWFHADGTEVPGFADPEHDTAGYRPLIRGGKRVTA